MKENTLIHALIAVNDKITRLKGVLADAEKYAADPKTLDKEFWFKEAEKKQKYIKELIEVHKDLLHTETEPNGY
jgi:hypothetical protein